MAEAVRKETSPEEGLRGGEFNRAAARQPGAEGIGARLRTEEVDPYHPTNTEHDATSKPQLTKGEESTTH